MYIDVLIALMLRLRLCCIMKVSKDIFLMHSLFTVTLAMTYQVEETVVSQYLQPSARQALVDYNATETGNLTQTLVQLFQE